MRSLFLLLIWVTATLAAHVELVLDEELVTRYRTKPGLGARAAAGATVPFEYPLFSQCDSKWGSDLMVTKTVCQVGCLMSSTSMAIMGFGIPIPPPPSTQPVTSNPGTLNSWLKSNNGYDDSNDFIESAAQNIDPQRIVWPADAMHTSNDLSYETISSYLQKRRVVIANVNQGHHFVLVVGYSTDNDTLIVHDPGSLVFPFIIFLAHPQREKKNSLDPFSPSPCLLSFEQAMFAIPTLTPKTLLVGGSST